MSDLLRPEESCRPRTNVIYRAVCIAALFIVLSTQVRVELAGNRVRVHFPVSIVSALRATVELLGHRGAGENSL